jgi:omega-6 fatty acid desaturase (delta-12 desaturase)
MQVTLPIDSEQVRTPGARRPPWQTHVARFSRPDRRQAIWQLTNTFLPYAGLWALMILTVERGLPYWVTLALAVPAAGLLVRIFIFFHDAGHGSFFASRRANTILGYVTGILTFTPFHDWTHAHALHHASAGNLDRRGTGDIWTMTVSEYLAAPWHQRLAYRVFRNPGIMLTIGPVLVFLILPRFPRRGKRKLDRNSIWITNLAIAAILVVAGLTIGLRTYALVQLPIIVMAASAGVWLFYVQHQYEGTYWARDGEWNFYKAALEGSSYYQLPRVLQWFTGNIGLHHIHHLQPRIPNYRLQQCYDAVPAVQAVTPVTLRSSLRSLRLNLWDEAQQKLVSFRALTD